MQATGTGVAETPTLARVWANCKKSLASTFCDELAPISTMSTENMSPASKDKSDKMSKKRRREEELAQSKEANAAAEPESTPAKKLKKSKKDRESAVKQESTEEATERATPSKKEKKKKSKSTEVQPEETIAQDATTAASGAKSDESEDSEVEAPKKSKKKSKNTTSEIAEANGSEESKPAISATTTTAISSKYLHSKSPFVQQTTSFYLALSPIAHHFPLEGLCAEHISPLILTYYAPLKGVVLSYNDPRLSESPEKGAKVSKGKESKTVLGTSVDEYAVTFVWLTVDLLIFKPQRGTVLEGYVNLQNESILGLICYNYFNAGIERSRLPKDWQWVADEATEETGEMSRKRRDAAGHYVNAEGNKVEGKIIFKVKDFEATAGAETGSGSINIYGTLLTEGEDAKVDEEAKQKTLVVRPARR
jgi:DNA-directed RNA polymerase I subunit RPA43